MGKNVHYLATSLMFLAAATFRAPASPSQTNYTSITPGTVWLADDGVHIDCHGGNIIYSQEKNRFFWYGEHYANPAGVACYSSADLYNWTKEGIVLQKGVIPVCERPKVIYSPSINKYIMWFHYDNSNYTLAHLAVATADSATGQFTMLKHFLPNGHQSRDIGMFTDTTGKTYIIYAADQTNVTIRMVELTEDYTDITNKDVDLNTHCEGPGVCKYKGNYYMITSPCLGWNPGRATWYMSSGITGTYQNKGDPCINDYEHNTFNSQSCFIFKVPGYIDAYIYMGDRWNGYGNKNSQYVFLPIEFSPIGELQLRFRESWNLDVFTPAVNTKAPRPTPTLRQAAGRYTVYDIRGRRLSATNANSRISAPSPKNAGVYIITPPNGVPARIIIGD